MPAILVGFLLGVFCTSLAAAQNVYGEENYEEMYEALGDLEQTIADGDLSVFSADVLENLALEAFEKRQMVRARTMTEELLRRDAESVGGHCLLGMIYYRADGAMPRALFHLERCRGLAKERGLEAWSLDWSAVAVNELASVHGAMGNHTEKIAFLDVLEQEYGFSAPADYGWPLMRLRLYDAARQKAMQGLLEAEEPYQRNTARTALCAIEAEQQKREEGYEACVAAAEFGDEGKYRGGPTLFTNAAEASLGVLRFDEAEKYLREATQRFRSETVSNPWLDMMLLYVTEGRLSEALDAMRRMFKWRRSQPAFMDEQNLAETELASAIFLLVGGHAEEAGRMTRRLLERPDRTGFTSSESEQMEAAHALVDALAQKVGAESAAERASWSTFWDAQLAWAEAQRRRLRAWTSERQAAALLADERILHATLRPYLAGSIELPEWLEPELVGALGPGVVEASLSEARAQETMDEAGGYFAVYAAEIASERGDWDVVQQEVEIALEELPSSEVLLRARTAGRGAQAAFSSGSRRQGVAWLDLAMQLDPGVVRRLGLRLPAVFEANEDPVARAVVAHLEGSPRLQRLSAEESGFRVMIEWKNDVGNLCLVGLRDTSLGCSRVTPRQGETPEDVARRMARSFHRDVFAPRLDLTQADLQSLDGSPTAAGGRSSERLRSTLRDLVRREER